jgi:3-oxoadipate enol-lactonase
MIHLVNSFMMNISDVGDGLPIIFVHGYPLSNRIWEPQTIGLSDVARVIAPDLRGHGKSQVIPGPYTMELFADDLAALLDTLKIQKKVVICGLSMGGYATLAFYRKYAVRVAGLILAGTRAGDDSPQARLNRVATVETARSKGIEAVVNGMLPKMLAPLTADRNDQLVNQVKSIMMSISLEGMIADLQAMKDRPDSRPLLLEITVPVLILHGLDDQLIPSQEAKDMQIAIPVAKIQLIPNAGHLLNLEQSETFNSAVRNFISGSLKE